MEVSSMLLARNGWSRVQYIKYIKSPLRRGIYVLHATSVNANDRQQLKCHRNVITRNGRMVVWNLRS